MKKWCLVCCFEREIEHPLFFDTKKEAWDAMVKDFARTSGITIDEVMEVYNSGENTYCEVTDTDAWCNNRGNYDWRIFCIAGEV